MFRRYELPSIPGNRFSSMPRKGLFVAAFALVAAGVVGSQIAYNAQPDEQVRITVDKKERIVESDGDSVSSKYMIFTDEEVFENTDSLTRGKFNSSDLYAKLKEGCTYDATVFGFRNHLLSSYRNIVKAQHVPTEKCPTARGPR